MGELLLERLPLADVAAVQNDAAHVLVVQQVGVLHLEAEQRTVAVIDRAFDRVAFAHSRAVDCDQLREQWPVGFGQQAVEALSFDLVGAIAEHTLDRRALVRDDSVRIEDGDQIARVRDEGAETRFALAPVQIGGERCAFDRERDLRRERAERICEIACDGLGGRDDQRAADLTADGERRDDCRMALGQPEVAAHVRRELSVDDLLRLRNLAQPVAGGDGDRAAGGPVRRSLHHGVFA